MARLKEYTLALNGRQIKFLARSKVDAFRMRDKLVALEKARLVANRDVARLAVKKQYYKLTRRDYCPNCGNHDLATKPAGYAADAETFIVCPECGTTIGPTEQGENNGPVV